MCSVCIRPFSIVQKCPNHSTVGLLVRSIIGDRHDSSRLRLIICHSSVASVPSAESLQMIQYSLSLHRSNTPIVLSESLVLWLNHSRNRSRDDCESLVFVCESCVHFL
jgi:hypothetical protein